MVMSESERAHKTHRRAQRVRATLCGPTSQTGGSSLHRNYSTAPVGRTTTCEDYFRLNNSCARLPPPPSARRLQESQSSRLDRATRLKRIDELAEDGSLGQPHRPKNHCAHYNHRHRQQVDHKTRLVDGASPRVRSKMLRLIRWPLVHLCLPLCLTNLMIFTVLVLIAGGSGLRPPQQVECSPAGTRAAISTSGPQHRNSGALPERRATGATRHSSGNFIQLLSSVEKSIGLNSQPPPDINQNRPELHQRVRRSLLMPINELRVSGSKLEPPSRPSQDWSKQRPYFGSNIQRNISVELGKTAHLTCKVFELGDKTVSWLRPRENEILTAGKYTYIGDSRISSMNELASPDWILEIKDVGLNDSASYECQVSTDPKMSMIINLHVQAARAKIRQGENNYYPVGANVEFSCEVLPAPSSSHPARFSSSASSLGSDTTNPGEPHADNNQQQIYWYHNGNLVNYARAHHSELGARHSKFAIDWDQASQTSRLKLANIQLGDSGNYTCKPSSAEPATVRLFVKKPRIGGSTNRVHYSGGSQPKEAAQSTSNRQHYGLDLLEVSSSALQRTPIHSTLFMVLAVCVALVL